MRQHRGRAARASPRRQAQGRRRQRQWQRRQQQGWLQQRQGLGRAARQRLAEAVAKMAASRRLRLGSLTWGGRPRPTGRARAPRARRTACGGPRRIRRQEGRQASGVEWGQLILPCRSKGEQGVENYQASAMAPLSVRPPSLFMLPHLSSPPDLQAASPPRVPLPRRSGSGTASAPPWPTARTRPRGGRRCK